MKRLRSIPLHASILLGLVLGATAGGLSNLMLGADSPRLVWFANNVTDPIGQSFLRLLLLMVVPLVF
jgi:DAACS family dicarboxylate/amino acid:cation (Na+ or H+) symporter